jgi:hypothetical protein
MDLFKRLSFPKRINSLINKAISLKNVRFIITQAEEIYEIQYHRKVFLVKKNLQNCVSKVQRR